MRSYGVEEDSLFVPRREISNELRNVAIFLRRNLAGCRLEEIGRDFNMRKYNSVSTIVERTKQRAIKDCNLKDDALVKSPETVMPELIRHPEHIEITGFSPSRE